MSNVLALAQYAHTRLEPLFARAKEVEPSLQFEIDLTFANEDSVHHRTSHLHVWGMWSREGVFQNSGALEDMADVDRFEAKVAADVVELEAK